MQKQKNMILFLELLGQGNQGKESLNRLAKGTNVRGES